MYLPIVVHISVRHAGLGGLIDQRIFTEHWVLSLQISSQIGMKPEMRTSLQTLVLGQAFTSFVLQLNVVEMNY